MAALGCRAIVTSVVPNLLEAKLDPSPVADHVQTVLRAARAPGVHLVVAVLPLGDAYGEAELLFRREGTPFVILRCAPLVEELADAANFHVTGSLWLPRGKTIALATAPELASTVVKALDEGSWQGRTVSVASENVDLAEAVRRAARVAGASTEVRAAPPAISALQTKLSGWFGLRPPPARALYERMSATTA
jgi:hypothetical protein